MRNHSFAVCQRKTESYYYSSGHRLQVSFVSNGYTEMMGVLMSFKTGKGIEQNVLKVVTRSEKVLPPVVFEDNLEWTRVFNFRLGILWDLLFEWWNVLRFWRERCHVQLQWHGLHWRPLWRCVFTFDLLPEMQCVWWLGFFCPYVNAWRSSLGLTLPVADQCTTTKCEKGQCETQQDGSSFCECDDGYMGKLCNGRFWWFLFTNEASMALELSAVSPESKNCLSQMVHRSRLVKGGKIYFSMFVSFPQRRSLTVKNWTVSPAKENACQMETILTVNVKKTLLVHPAVVFLLRKTSCLFYFVRIISALP